MLTAAIAQLFLEQAVEEQAEAQESSGLDELRALRGQVSALQATVRERS